MLVIIIGTCLPGISQTKEINRFIRNNRYEYYDDFRKIGISGFLIRLGSNIAKNHAEDEEEKAALKLAKKIRKVKLLIAEDSNPIPAEKVDQFIHRLKAKENFFDMLMVRSQDTNVRIMVREKGDMLKNLMVLVFL